MRNFARRTATLSLLAFGLACTVAGCGANDRSADVVTLNDAEIEDLVRRSYQYVAMYNVNNKGAMIQGGWNSVKVDTALKDHTHTSIARPNNDTLYISAALDLRAEPMIIEMPAFESNYVSLMITGYDHYVNVPMSSRLEDFEEPAKMIVYSARTEGYTGAAPAGIDESFEATGDFVSAVLRVMPHASDPERFARIQDQMQQVRVYPLSTLLGTEPKVAPDPEFPDVGKADADVFANNLLEVMQVVFNHTTFDTEDPLDAALLAAYKPLGVVPGRRFDPDQVSKLDGSALRSTAERFASDELARSTDPEFAKRGLTRMFLPKGQMTLEMLAFQSVLGPIGMPAFEAVYPALSTADDQPMNALHDYAIRMDAEDMPPAGAFWSITLYDLQNGFFIPNERKKYSVGENAGMKLDDDRGITIYIAASQPGGAPVENWLPIERTDLGIGVILRIYEPDLEVMKTWDPPTISRLES
jgi:hypothetical protein